VLCQAQEYLEEQSRILLKKCRKASGSFFFSEDFFGQAVILKEYGILLAMEELSGQRKDLSAVHVRQVLELWEKQTGRRIALPYGLEAVRGYGGVYLRKGENGQEAEKESHESKRRSCVRKSGENSWFLPVPGELKCPLGTFRTEIFSWKNQKIEEKKYTKWLDYDKIEGSLTIRTRKEGDYMAADREGRHKKLTRVMIDRKIPGEERDHIPLVAAGQEILWIAGDRMNDRYRITGDTRRVLQVQYTKEDLRQ
ncbi:MAG: tRNA lysidine(34) synthetase TilS, partial [Clostridiales bacterium]|nr:tRNA lysidine(34) synthetase TilS [Clostridiales bacterium]